MRINMGGYSFHTDKSTKEEIYCINIGARIVWKKGLREAGEMVKLEAILRCGADRDGDCQKLGCLDELPQYHITSDIPAFLAINSRCIEYVKKLGELFLDEDGIPSSSLNALFPLQPERANPSFSLL
jgi:hypothetical protein